MRTLETMSKVERRLLLYLEDAAVNTGGQMEAQRMNAEDFALLTAWAKEGFVESGRIALEFRKGALTHWCRLSDEAWTLAAAERKARATRCWAARRFKTSEEANAERAL